MEKVKITKCDIKESGMFVVGFTDPQGFNPGEATGNKKWQDAECTFLSQSIGCIVKLETKQNGQYCNITKVDMSTAPTQAMPVTASEKIVDVPKAGLMSVRDVQIISQCMMKCMFYNKTPDSPEEVYEAYEFFVKKLEENG